MPDGLIDPQTAKRPESGSAAPDTYPAFLFALVALCIAVFFFLAAVRGRSVGIPIAAMVGYTFLFALFAFKSRVPLDRLTRGRFLLGHGFALVIVYAIAIGALAAYPHLPTWFTDRTLSRGGSLFRWCLFVVFLALAVCEYFWALRDEGEEVFKVEIK